MYLFLIYEEQVVFKKLLFFYIQIKKKDPKSSLKMREKYISDNSTNNASSI